MKAVLDLCHLEHTFGFEVLKAGLGKSRFSPLTCMEPAADVPETIMQMRLLFFGLAASLHVDQAQWEPILPLAEGCSCGSWEPAVALKA